MDERAKELIRIVGTLRNFFLQHADEPPLAIVLSDRKSLDFMRHIAQPYQDIDWVKNRAFVSSGVNFRFESPPTLERSDYALKEAIRRITEDAKAQAQPYIDELARREHLRPPSPCIIPRSICDDS